MWRVKLRIGYETTYYYDAPVRFSRHQLRLFPRGNHFTRLLHFQFGTNEKATVRFARDVFDNCVVICNYPEPARELQFGLHLDLALERMNPFDFILSS
jgi:hypothetical protein